ncbi:hypothetical protein [Nocardioides mangrovi]|uniref:Uncharacterized protein n=1 Tax=Nocardioides mangrovi TaxID=2874580 RepID=A0ABS7UH47_9ACTN|nr:hypothetical protein [Nocardioides mangrovi]MBZ5739948.1 hypothetical protein [Nocardioides mangrovi]
MTSPLPASARLAWWGTSWLRGQVVTDLLVDAVLGDDATHAVAGLPGSDVTETLVGALARLRSLGATALGAAFPAEGDPLGLGGPRRFNADALEAGEAVVVSGTPLGLVPLRTGAATVWTCQPADRRQLPDVGEADRDLRAGLIAAAEALADLDVARWRPEVADELMDLRHRDPLVAPDGVPARCVELAARGLRAMTIVGLALADDGGAVSAGEASARRAALVPLDRVGRRALTAACSPEVWPPA